MNIIIPTEINPEYIKYDRVLRHLNKNEIDVFCTRDEEYKDYILKMTISMDDIIGYVNEREMILNFMSDYEDYIEIKKNLYHLLFQNNCRLKSDWFIFHNSNLISDFFNQYKSVVLVLSNTFFLNIKGDIAYTETENYKLTKTKSTHYEVDKFHPKNNKILYIYSLSMEFGKGLETLTMDSYEWEIFVDDSKPKHVNKKDDSLSIKEIGNLINEITTNEKQLLPDELKKAAQTVGLDLTKNNRLSEHVYIVYDKQKSTPKNFNLKLEEDTLNEYRAICEEYTLNMSARIREFIKADIKKITENEGGTLWFKK